jgi:hypothetical protein
VLNLRLEFKGLDTFARQLSVFERGALPQAAALAVNRIGIQFQREERALFPDVFTVRKPDFLKREGVKRLSPAATPSNLSVIFGVSARADFLNRFERGDTKRPRDGRNLAIPVNVRRNQRDIITHGNRPRALIERLGSKKGALGVFALPQPRGTLPAGVYQRTGRKGHGPLKMLYLFEPSVPSAPVLRFQATAERVARDWPTFFDQALEELLRRRR